MEINLDEKLSEFLGAMAGDGCLSVYTSNNRTRSITLMTGNLLNDTQYYEDVLQPIIIEKFGQKGYLYHRKDDNSIRFFMYSKNIFNFFNRLGIPIGLKTEIKIPKIINENKQFKLAFIRGMFNTDGTVYSRYSKKYKNHSKHYKNYAVVQFKLINQNVIKFIKKSLDSFGIKTTKVGNIHDYYVCRITSQKCVDAFFSAIKTKHKYHLSRYNQIRNF